MEALKSANIKIAVMTSDDRSSTLLHLKNLGISEYVESIVCGNDDIEKKPHPAGFIEICSQLGVHPSKAVMVGDTRADLLLARAAGAGLTIGVLSGTGNAEELTCWESAS